MPTYNGNFLNMMNAHTNLYNGDGTPKERIITQSDPNKDTLDIRQILTNIVGRGYKSLSDDSIRADYAKLTNIVGMTQARQLVDHAIIYNQTANNKNSPVEARVQSFFNAPANDKNVNAMLQRVSKFGDGVVAGLSRSPDVGNQQLAGTYDEITSINQKASDIKDVATKNIKDATVKIK